MEIPKKASIRDILDSRTLSYIAQQLDKEDQKSMVEALKLPRLKTNIKELKEAKTKHKLILNDKIITPSIIQIMTKRMIDGLAPPRELFTSFNWSELKKNKSLNQTIFMFLNEYLKHFVLKDELAPLVHSIDWKSIKSNSDAGLKTIDFLIQSGIIEKFYPLQIQTRLHFPNQTPYFDFALEVILEFLAIDLATLLEPGQVSLENLKYLLDQDPELKQLYKSKNKKHNSMLKKYIQSILDQALGGDYRFDSEAFQVYLSILGGVVERALHTTNLRDLYLHLESILAPSSKDILQKMKESEYEYESLHDMMKNLESKHEMVNVAKNNLQRMLIEKIQESI